MGPKKFNLVIVCMGFKIKKHYGFTRSKTFKLSAVSKGMWVVERPWLESLAPSEIFEVCHFVLFMESLCVYDTSGRGE